MIPVSDFELMSVGVSDSDMILSLRDVKACSEFTLSVDMYLLERIFSEIQSYAEKNPMEG